MLRRFSYLTISFCLATLVATSIALAGEIEVDGTVVRGAIVAVTADGVDIEPEFGSGTLTIAFDDIDRIESDTSFFVLFNEEDEARGKLLGIDDGHLLVGDDAASATRVPVGSIYAGYEIDGTVSRIQRLRSQWRYWTGALNAGYGITSGTTDTTNTTVGLRGERRKPGTRFLFSLDYLFATEKQRGRESSTLNNEVHGHTKAEYDLTDWLLAIGSFDAEYDEIERLSYRLVPKLGLGYRLYRSDKAFFQIETAPAYVAERFFGGVENDYVAISFGAEGEYKLPYSAVLAGRAEYLPAVDDWGNDYLIRSEISFTMPLVGFVNFRAALSNQYDNTPAEGTDRNELQSTLGLAVIF